MFSLLISFSSILPEMYFSVPISVASNTRFAFDLSGLVSAVHVMMRLVALQIRDLVSLLYISVSPDWVLEASYFISFRNIDLFFFSFKLFSRLTVLSLVVFLFLVILSWHVFLGQPGSCRWSLSLILRSIYAFVPLYFSLMYHLFIFFYFIWFLMTSLFTLSHVFPKIGLNILLVSNIGFAFDVSDFIFAMHVIMRLIDALQMRELIY